MGRILAVDFGTKRTGLAATDPLQIIASPLTAVRTFELMSYLGNYMEKEEVDTLVVGWPTQEDGSDTNNTPHVRAFVNQLKKKFTDIHVVLQDEFNTSNIAMKSMIAGGVKKKARRDKMKIDMTSAVLILQSYLEERA